MNGRRVVILMTVAVFCSLMLVTVAVAGIPPWPVWLWFIVSHVFFCAVILRVKPYRGPYVEPMGEPGIEKD